MSTQSALHQQLEGYRLATAEILYHLPDYPAILQSYVWQDYDVAPAYPVLNKFLTFWETELEGRLHSVKLAGKKIISAAEIQSGTLLVLN